MTGKTILMTLLGVTLWSHPDILANNQMYFSYNDGQNDEVMWGTQKKENYDVAIHIDNPEFIGAKVIGMRFGVYNSDDVGNYRAWMTRELALEGKNNKPDITSQNVERQDGTWRIEVLFDTPYTIGEEGVYVGYSCDVFSIDKKGGCYPIAAVEGINNQAMFVHTSRTYLKWKDISETAEVYLSLEVLLEGNFLENAVKAVSISEVNVKSRDTPTTTVTVANMGVTPISEIGYSYSIGQDSYSGVQQFSPAIEAKQGYSARFDLELPAVAEIGTYPLELKVETVNSEPNSCQENAVRTTYNSVSRVPQHNAYVEEFTGTWCGYCPRGFVAMELMGERHPDFVGVAYHNGDPMAIAGNDLDSGSGYPSAMIDRKITCDPYYGTSEEETFGFEPLWEEYCKIFTPFEIALKAYFTSEDMTAVTIEADVTSVKDIEGKQYRVEYVLVEDGMAGTTASWLQTNYYSKDESARGLEGMDMFIDGASYMFLTYNDVAVANTGNLGVEGSLPETIERDVTYSHSHTFKIADLQNSNRQPIVLDPAKLRVAVLVVDNDGSRFGTISNSAKCDLVDLTGITSVSEDLYVKSITWFDLTGKVVNEPAHGLYIQRLQLSDGTFRTQKVLRK